MVLRTPTLNLMKGKEIVPKHADTTLLPGGTMIGNFWRCCKAERKCGRPPYDWLLDNPALREDYRTTAAARESSGQATESCQS